MEEQYPMVGLVQWHYFIFFMMESGSANLEIQPAQMKCEFASPCSECCYQRFSNLQPKAHWCLQLKQDWELGVKEGTLELTKCHQLQYQQYNMS